MQLSPFEFRENRLIKILCKRDNGLPFGKRLGRICVGDKLPDKLYSLLLYLYVSASQVCHLIPLCHVQKKEYRELKSKLKKNRPFPLCHYSENAALAALKSFLKELPYPILDKEKWKSISDRFFTEEVLTAATIKAMGREIVALETQNMTHCEKGLFHHLIVVIREASKDRRKKRIQFDRLIKILDYLGPALIRHKDPYLNRHKPAQLDGIDKVFLTFVVCFVDQIYGRDLDKLFPPQSTFKIRHTYERMSYKLFNPYH